MSPLCQTHIEPDELNHMEPFYPLQVWLCTKCFLVQLEEYVKPAEVFSDYAYFSSYSDSWVERARRYASGMTGRLGLGRNSMVMEIASNDGYLLQHFVKSGVPCLGIEPAANVAAAAVAKGIPTVSRFFGVETARWIASEYQRPDLLLGNNVLAHVPDINDFVAGVKVLLQPQGVVTMEFPHLLQLMTNNQFDTAHHEHFSYLSFTTVERIFAHHGLTIFDVQELATHGWIIANLRATRRECVQAGGRLGFEHDEDRECGRADRGGRVFRLPGQGARHEAKYPRIFDRCEAKRTTRGWLRRARQGQHFAQLLRNQDGLSRLHGGSQSSQAGSLCARHAHTNSGPLGNTRVPSGFCLPAAVEPEGRDHRAVGVHSGVRWTFCGANSGNCRHRLGAVWLFLGRFVRISTQTEGRILKESRRLLGNRVLITGASGFLGSRLSRQLADLGAEVHGVTRRAPDALCEVREGRVPGLSRWWSCNLESLEQAKAVWDAVKPDVVYHLSGEVKGAPRLEPLLPWYHSLLTTTVNMLHLAATSGCKRLVLTTSLEDEEYLGSSGVPASPYAAAKLGLLHFSRMCHASFGVPIVILRQFMGYDPGQPHWKLIPSVVSALQQGEPPILSSGSRLLGWVSVDDMVEAFVTAGKVPDIEGKTLDVGTRQLTSIREIVESLVALVNPGVPPEFGRLPDRPPQPPRRADTADALRHLGWSARTALAEGLRRTVQSHLAA